MTTAVAGAQATTEGATQTAQTSQAQQGQQGQAGDTSQQAGQQTQRTGQQAGQQQQTGQTTAQTQTAGQTAGQQQTAGPPAKYELTVSQADAAFADAEDLKTFEAYAREQAMTQEEAATFVTDQIALRRGAHSRLFEAVKAHPEIGGANLEAAQRRANAVLDRFLPTSDTDGAMLRRDLNRLGLSNYPPLVKLLARVGAAMADDRPGVLGGPASPDQGRKPIEQVVYPNG